MERILKYKINENRTEIEVPELSKLLKVMKDANGDICVWFLVNDKSENIEIYSFDIIGLILTLL